MSKVKLNYHFTTPLPTVCKNPEFEIVIDQRSGFKELSNSAGWPANEITLLAKLQLACDEDSALAKLLERSLFELPTPSVDNSNKTNAEIIQAVIPKYCGTLSEYLKWVSTLPLSENERALLDKQAEQVFEKEDVKEDIPQETA